MSARMKYDPESIQIRFLNLFDVYEKEAFFKWVRVGNKRRFEIALSLPSLNSWLAVLKKLQTGMLLYVAFSVLYQQTFW